MARLTESAFQRNRVKQRNRNTRNNPKRPRQFGRLLTDITDLESRPFIGWDGEGYTEFVVGEEIVPEQRYMLFGNSLGERIKGRSLGTEECFDLMLTTESENRDAIHVAFASEYDVNMMIKDFSWRHIAMLYDVGCVKWKGYRIKHTPDKLFTVSKGGVVCTLYNVFGFFHSSYVDALKKYEIGDPEVVKRIEAGKSMRNQFTWSDFDLVEKYWEEEISLFTPLMEKLREAAYSAGFFITEWHGPGALASYALNQHNAREFKSRNSPTPVKMARQLAYAGGRFQAWRAGYLEAPIYTADINSAYAYAASLLPRLDNGTWRTIPGHQIDRIERFALYQIEFDMPRDAVRRAQEWGIPFPLFHRGKDGRLTWPHRVHGWYWSPEAATVFGSPYAKFRQALVYEDDGTKPFEWIAGAYNRRLQLQDSGHPAEKAYKWMLAAMYGQWAQRVGWDKEKRTAPKSHQLEFAGFITSLCRAMVFRTASHVARQGGLVSIDTDGVTSTVPFNESMFGTPVGTELGGWKLEEYSGILYWQNGIYWLRSKETGEWEKPKTRGIPRGRLAIGDAFEAIRESGQFSKPGGSSIPIQRNNFVGYGQAMQGQFDSWRHWVPRRTDVTFGGTGKGLHIPQMCPKCSVCGGIPLHSIAHIPPDSFFSEPHKLPWLEPVPDVEKNVSDLIWRDDCL